MNDLDTQSTAPIDLPLHNDVATRTHSTTDIRTTRARETRAENIGTAARP